MSDKNADPADETLWFEHIDSPRTVPRALGPMGPMGGPLGAHGCPWGAHENPWGVHGVMGDVIFCTSFMKQAQNGDDGLRIGAS